MYASSQVRLAAACTPCINVCTYKNTHADETALHVCTSAMSKQICAVQNKEHSEDVDETVGS